MTVRAPGASFFVWANRQSRGLSFAVEVPIVSASIR
jgi:hypothetical protein